MHELCQLSNSIVSFYIPSDNFRIRPHPIHDIVLRRFIWDISNPLNPLPVDSDDGLFLGKS